MSADALTQFRLLLDHLDPGDRQDILAFFRILDEVGPDAAVELGHRIKKTTVERSFRGLVYEAAYYHPWVDWLEFLSPALRRESDAEIFEIGAMALGRMGSQAAPVIQELYQLRHTPAFQEVLSRELINTDPKAAFKYLLGRLLQGSTNTRVANDAAVEMAKVVNNEALPELLKVVAHEDILIARHALKLVTLIPSVEAATYLLAHLQELHREILEDRQLKELLNRLKGVPISAQKEALLETLRAYVAERYPEHAAALNQEGTAQLGALSHLRTKAESTFGKFMVEAMGLVSEGKGVKLNPFIQEAGEALHLRSRRTSFAADATPQGLWPMVKAGLVDRASTMEALQESFRRQTGREGVASALAHLVASQETEVLELLLSGEDAAMRSAAIETLGGRKDKAFLPWLLRGCRDPIIDIAQKAIHAIGPLEGAVETAEGLLASQNSDDIRLGIRIAAANRMASTVPQLLELAQSGGREDLAVDAILALGQIGTPGIPEPLLAQLHSGQSARMLIALATCLRDLGEPVAARALAEKALQLRQAPVLALAAEALIGAYAGPKGPMPLEVIPELRTVVLTLWDDKDPWPLRHRLALALQGLRCQDSGFLEEMVGRFGALLTDKRAGSAWSPEQLAAVQAATKELTRRVDEMKG